MNAPSVSVGDSPRVSHPLTIHMRSTNPSRGDIRAGIDLGESTFATVDLVDVRGRRVERLFRADARGTIEVATRNAGSKLAAGVYFLSVRTERATASARVVILP